MTTPREHADAAARYFADKLTTCWAREKNSNKGWTLLREPAFSSIDLEYYVGHEPPPPDKRTINLPAATIELHPGEQYAGLVLKDDGMPSHHLVLMAELPDSRLTWEDAKEWAAELGGALPTRTDAPLIFAHCRSHITPDWHWLSETDVCDGSYAWACHFSTNKQSSIYKLSDFYAIAVRHIPIGE